MTLYIFIVHIHWLFDLHSDKRNFSHNCINSFNNLNNNFCSNFLSIHLTIYVSFYSFMNCTYYHSHIQLFNKVLHIHQRFVPVISLPKSLTRGCKKKFHSPYPPLHALMHYSSTVHIYTLYVYGVLKITAHKFEGKKKNLINLPQTKRIEENYNLRFDLRTEARFLLNGFNDSKVVVHFHHVVFHRCRGCLN